MDQAGHESATTGRIAHLAGVSIGSLYQYFPGKEALFGALTERAMETDLRRMREAVDRARDMPLEAGTEEVLRACFAFALERPRLLCWMLRYLPALGLLPAVERMERTLVQETRRFLEDHRAELAGLDLDVQAIRAVGAIRGALVLLAREKPSAMEGGRVLEMAVDMMLGTLRAQREWGRARDEYLAENDFDVAGYTAPTVRMKFFGRYFDLPNSPDRRWAIPLHGLHHVATGYGTDFVGEAEIGAWELRAGCRRPIVYALNVTAVLIGLVPIGRSADALLPPLRGALRAIGTSFVSVGHPPHTPNAQARR